MKITHASWTDEDGKKVEMEFEPPHSNIWHTLLELRGHIPRGTRPQKKR